MKYFLWLFTFLISVSPAFSKCANNGIYFTSPATVLNKNGIIILEFYGNSQTCISGLGDKYPVYLKSSEGKTNLLVKKILKGSFRLTQVILTSEKPLNEFLTYEFFIDKLPKNESKPIRQGIDGLYDKKPITFTVVKDSRKEVASFSHEPTEQKKCL